MQDVTSLLSTLVRGVVSVRAGLPSWLKPLVPDLSPLLEVGLEFVHHGALNCPSCTCLLWLPPWAARRAVAWLVLVPHEMLLHVCLSSCSAC